MSEVSQSYLYRLRKTVRRLLFLSRGIEYAHPLFALTLTIPTYSVRYSIRTIRRIFYSLFVVTAAAFYVSLVIRSCIFGGGCYLCTVGGRYSAFLDLAAFAIGAMENDEVDGMFEGIGGVVNGRGEGLTGAIGFVKSKAQQKIADIAVGDPVD